MTAKSKALSQPDSQQPAKPNSIVTFDGRTATVDWKAAQKAFGSKDNDFIDGFVRQLVSIASPGKMPDDKGTAYAVSIVAGIAPKDEVEALLAAQMVAVHNATMKFASRLARVETIQQQDSAERAFNKLTRTFAAQMEALKRYRTGGQQKMTVEHVHVHDGGQAIVGNVSHGGQGDAQK